MEKYDVQCLMFLSSDYSQPLVVGISHKYIHPPYDSHLHLLKSINSALKVLPLRISVGNIYLILEIF